MNISQCVNYSGKAPLWVNRYRCSARQNPSVRLSPKAAVSCRNAVCRKQKYRLAAIFPKSAEVFGSGSCKLGGVLRLREPNRPIRASPVAKSGRAAFGNQGYLRQNFEPSAFGEKGSFGFHLICLKAIGRCCEY